MNAITRRIVHLLGISATYGCILILLDLGNYYARIFSWSGQSSSSWHISSALLAVLAAVAMTCDYALRPWGRRISILATGGRAPAAQKG
jgi:hypothetical protein